MGAAVLDLPSELQPLAKRLDDPRPNVLLVVGTGISLGATNSVIAGWKGLLLSGIQRCRELGASSQRNLDAQAELIEGAFDPSTPFDLDEVLRRGDALTEILGGTEGAEYATWLRDTVGSLRINQTSRRTIDAVADLVRAGALIMTTNYDDLLHEAIGLEPITWEEPLKILEVVARRRTGIIHIHGHWSRPSSVILGRRSYERIKAANLAQNELRGLWMFWHWVYVGCGGGGLSDPNLGALLQWTQEAGLGETTVEDYFLGTKAAVEALPEYESAKPSLVKHIYEGHDRLPGIVAALAPAARSSPFVRIGPSAPRIRRIGESPLSNPFPSWDEFKAGKVPDLAADTEVRSRLDEHGWAFVLDVASVGKTTLAYRVAAEFDHRGWSCYHILLSRTTFDDAEQLFSPQAALARIARPDTLIVIDDAHLNPELAAALWRLWRDRPLSSKLLLLATRIDRAISTPADSALLDLERDAHNPAISLRPTSDDLGRIAEGVLDRLLPTQHLIERPPAAMLSQWHSTYGTEIGAFVVAVTQNRVDLIHGQFQLPEDAGAVWMWQRHLSHLSKYALDNIQCLAVFGDELLELEVNVTCLPHPSPVHVSELLATTLVERTVVGALQHVRFRLREPSWGRLILAAMHPSADRLAIMEEAVIGNTALLVAALSALRRSDCENDLAELCIRLEHRRSAIVTRSLEAPISNVMELCAIASSRGWKTLIGDIYDALVADPKRLAARAFEMPLDHLGSFLASAAKHGQKVLVKDLCRELAADSRRLAARAFEAPLDHLGSFLATAAEQGQRALVDDLCRELVADPKRLANRAFNTQLGHVGSFLHDVARQGQGALVDNLWRELAADRRRLACRAFETPFHFLGSFLATAMRQGQGTLVDDLWKELAADPKRLADRALETPLHLLGSFLTTAMRQGQRTLVDDLWKELAADPKRLAARAVETRLNHLGSFLATAAEQGQKAIVDNLYGELAVDTKRLAKSASELDPNSLARFLSGAPETLAKAVVSDFSPIDWGYERNATRRGMPGASNLAGTFWRLDRVDLCDSLVDCILRRKQYVDFAIPNYEILEVARLLSMTKPEQFDMVGDLLDAVDLRLSVLYRAATAVIARALYDIALNQPPSIIRRFWHPAVTYRLRTFFSTASRDLCVDAPDKANTQLEVAIELLGTSSLAGWTWNRQLLLGIPQDCLAQLTSLLPHRPGAVLVDQRQRQYWLGLRVAAWALGGQLPVDVAYLRQSHELWHANITGIDTWAGSDKEPESVMHRLNVSMFEWLGQCMRHGNGRLLASNIPLWTIVGFPRDPRNF
ncbi:MAG: SIR2 family protein [Alphaproteobacteria bacterium]|nr:SIR2 family protein [Alphaproteobacteria bacterium]MCW5743673.1 SIR2 family protein [Alphaproteobacteria bacterium]